jgi:tetratricopeptide (TPR) repeat protein
MAKLAQLPANDRAPEPDDAEARRRPRPRTRYYAFLSYSHKDEELAGWLHQELEEFRVPPALAGKLTANGVIPKRLTPIFRDQHELAAADDLGDEIEAALASSQFLIVLCSPDAARSRWTNAEIEAFKRTRPEGCVLAAIAAGEPFATEIPGREDEECFPPALRQKYDRRGRATGKRAEPLAADLRETGDGRRLGFLKLVAGMLGVGLDELVQRETTRRHRRLAWLAVVSLAGMAVTSTLALTAIQARDAARDQRREAEGLVAFMLGDLKDKLEPIGRLDALDGVGSRVLAYYSKQDTSQLSDAGLLQRSRALSLMGQVAYARGNMTGAVRLYRTAMAGTDEASRRDPNDAQRLFDHAQNVFWLAQIASEQGQLKPAEAGFREYKRLALRMVALGPDNMKWRMEAQYADADLGIVLYNQRRFAEAISQFAQALQTIRALSAADPGNRAYQVSTGQSLAWLADAMGANGRVDDAIRLREQEVALVQHLLGSDRSDVTYRQLLVPAQRSLGWMYGLTGRGDLALGNLQAAVATADQLSGIEPGNMVWRQWGFQARLTLARELLEEGRAADAEVQTNAACATVAQLLARSAAYPAWRGGARDCEMMRARLALDSHAADQAVSHAEKAVRAAQSVKSSDEDTDRFALAAAYLLLGDAQRASGDMASAALNWSNALSAARPNVAEKPTETANHAATLQRLGRLPEANALRDRLRLMGIRRFE